MKANRVMASLEQIMRAHGGDVEVRDTDGNPVHPEYDQGSSTEDEYSIIMDPD